MTWKLMNDISIFRYDRNFFKIMSSIWFFFNFQHFWSKWLTTISFTINLRSKLSSIQYNSNEKNCFDLISKIEFHEWINIFNFNCHLIFSFQFQICLLFRVRNKIKHEIFFQINDYIALKELTTSIEKVKSIFVHEILKDFFRVFVIVKKVKDKKEVDSILSFSLMKILKEKMMMKLSIIETRKLYIINHNKIRIWKEMTIILCITIIANTFSNKTIFEFNDDQFLYLLIFLFHYSLQSLFYINVF